jgi:hypothetical protein
MLKLVVALRFEPGHGKRRAAEHGDFHRPLLEGPRELLGLRNCRTGSRDEEQKCEEETKNQHAGNQIIRLEYARPFTWRSAHGQETPQDGKKEDVKISQANE